MPYFVCSLCDGVYSRSNTVPTAPYYSSSATCLHWYKVLHCICTVITGGNLFCPSYSSIVLSGVGLVGGNPTMNTPRLRRKGRIASSLSFFLLVVVLL